MKRIFKLTGAALFATLFLISCGPTAHIEKAGNVNFNNYKTFAWAEPKKRTGRQDIVEQRVREAISMELERGRGWQETNNNPDVLLSYDMLVDRGSRVVSDPMYSWGGFRSFYNPYARRFYNVYYPSMFMGYDNYSVPTRDGTIAITMVDARTEKTILQGWATDEIDSRRFTAKEVDRIVRAIFKKWDSNERYNRGYTSHKNRYD